VLGITGVRSLLLYIGYLLFIYFMVMLFKIVLVDFYYCCMGCCVSMLLFRCVT